MKRPLLISVLFLVAGWIGWLVLKPDQEQAELVATLKARQRTRFEPPSTREIDWDSRERKGLAMAPPQGLLVSYDSEKKFWTVGRRGLQSVVQIPFGAGKVPNPPTAKDQIQVNPGFVGAQTCRECHQGRYDDFVQTNHYRTSRPASVTTISGPVSAGNQIHTRHEQVSFEVRRRGSRVYQHTNFLNWQFQVPTDIVIGSPILGESYLYWHGDKLFQTHLSYVVEQKQWINSPGYPDGDAIYSRPITARCMDCHFTYVDFREPPNAFTHSSVIYGVTCERCHGPGRDHVSHHQANPLEKQSRFVANPGKMSRTEQFQICGQCHSGIAPLRGLPFQFRPGDHLNQHYVETNSQSDGGVHSSNQLQRLALSRCFTESDLSCISCHNPHRLERANLKLFSQRCMKCHPQEACGMNEESISGFELADNCIDCHMPRRATANMMIETAQGSVFPPLRDHHIRVDPNATLQFLHDRVNE